MYNLKECGGRIKTLRKTAEKTQAEFAAMLNISMETISKIERGERGMSIDLLCDIASMCNVSTDYVLFGKKSDEMMAINKAKLMQLIEECF